MNFQYAFVADNIKYDFSSLALSWQILQEILASGFNCFLSDELHSQLFFKTNLDASVLKRANKR